VTATIEAGSDLALLDAAIDALPDQPAVFLLWAAEGEPFLSRTGFLRRRLRRLPGAAPRFRRPWHHSRASKHD